MMAETRIVKRCPFCHTEMEILVQPGKPFHCPCGAYAEIAPLSQAHRFTERAKEAFGIGGLPPGRWMETVDGGAVLDGKDEPIIIQWARRPRTSP